MTTLGTIFSSARGKKRVSLNKAAADLHLNREVLETIEEGDWASLPEPTFAKGFIKNYAQYLKLDADHMLALYRREYDEKKYPHKDSPIERKRRLMLTPNRLTGMVFGLGTLLFAAYLFVQYLSVLSKPKLELISPKDDITTSVPVIELIGTTEKETTISVDGQFVPVDANGNFAHQIQLVEGQNVIEVVAAKRLSPKAKVTRVVRLSK